MFNAKIGTRLLALLLAVIMTLSLVACNNDPEIEDESSKQPSSADVSKDDGKKDEPTKEDEKFFTDLEKAIDTNPEVIAYLDVPNTNIQYPILYNADSNFKYETKDINGEKSVVNGKSGNYTGAVYLSSYAKHGSNKSDMSSFMPLYGHNWTNYKEPYNIGNKDEKDIMFAQLMSYTDQKFAEENPYIYIYTPDGKKQTYKVFSAVYFNAFCNNYALNKGLTDKQFEALIKDATNRSLFDFGTKVTKDDKVISLVTCCRKYGNEAVHKAGGSTYNLQRFTVMARLVHEDEKIEEKVTVKKGNPTAPNWTKKSYWL